MDLDLLHNVIMGLQASLQPINILYCFLGVFIGTLIGVLPGIGPVGTMAILLPITFHVPPLSTVIMLSGIYYGAMYGGSTASILLNIPGEPAAIVTCLDGYQMARQGRAGPALGIAAFGSFIAGTIGVIGLMSLAGPLARVALRFGPPEYAGLMVVGLTLLSYLSGRSFVKAVIMGVLGLVLSFIGTDIITGRERFTFGIDGLVVGVAIVPMVMGLFGIAEVMVNLEVTVETSVYQTHARNLLPSRKDWARSVGPITRGTLIGFFLGILPGGGALLASFTAYAVEKKVSKHPEEFGKGAIEGVAAPESANNAASSSSFIPLLTLGIPPNVVMAMLFVGLMIHGIKPGPMLLAEHPDIFWGVIMSMYFGNIMLLVLNLPLIGMWVQLLKLSTTYLYPIIILFCLIGVYSINSSIFDIGMMLAFGIIGYVLRKVGYEPAPLALAFVLGPLLEQALRQSLLISNGNFVILVNRPISAVCFGVAALLVISGIISNIKGKRLLDAAGDEE
jgi:putative tricarboxylic transport membrane protein